MGNNVHNLMGKELAYANLQVSKAIGICIGFAHRTQLPVPVYAQKLDEESDDYDLPVGRRADHNTIQLMVPSQAPAWSGVSGFSGSWAIYPTYSGTANQPACGDRVEYPIGSQEWYYVEGNIKDINNGWSYVLSAVQSHTQTIGEKESGP